MSSTTQQPETAELNGRFDEIAHAMTTPEFPQDPYPLYARMRREHPVRSGWRTTNHNLGRSASLA